MTEKKTLGNSLEVVVIDTASCIYGEKNTYTL